MFRHVLALYGCRDLLFLWTMREIKIRYKQSLLGAAWAILQPLALMMVFTVVFSVLVQVPTDGIPYPAFSYTALLAWTFFATSVSFAVPALVNNLALVTKIYFPREILPLASVGAAFIDFLVAGILLLGILAWYQTPLTAALLWMPLVLILQILLILGVVLPASAISVFYRDVRFVVPLALQLWLYATPIVYPITMVPEAYRLFYALNPMVGIVDSYRRVLLQGSPPVPQYLAVSALSSIVLATVGYAYFKRAEDRFADFI
jgi:lipopolysaccharide transport system permease protein